MEDNDELVGDIVDCVINSGELDDLEWTEFSVVFEVNADGRMDSTYGYAYDPSGTATAFAPSPRICSESVLAYREWLRVEGDVGFSQLLFQFNRDTGRYNGEFEFDGISRWQVTPENVDRMIDALRPNLGPTNASSNGDE